MSEENKTNTGDGNSGNWNSGNRNSGYGNSGNWNSGDWNSGYGNSGNWNSGDWNSGYRNSGDWNSGNWNSGNWNSGNWNSGNWNSGNWNSGNWNSGDRNSGYGNSGNRSAGIFCTQSPTVICFNKDTGKSWEDIEHPDFCEFALNKWVPASEMTDKEKLDNPKFFTADGYLKRVDWLEAWKIYWEKSDAEEKRKVLGLPNFDAEIFKKITGIDVAEKITSCEGKEVVVDGKRYKLVGVDEPISE
jgi:hypothetical protein